MRNGVSVAALVALVLLSGGWSAATRADGAVRIDPPGPAVAGRTFELDVIVDSLPLGSGGPFAFTLTLALPEGVQVVAWSSVVTPPVCTRGSSTITCRSQVLGGEVHSSDIGFTIRASRPGSYTFVATAVLDGTPDSDPSNNRAQIEVTVGTAPSSGVTRRGTAGNDVVRGTAGNDRLYGLGGPDTLRGLGGNDLLDGGAGNDRLFGNAGLDRYVGGPGNDTIDAVDGRPETIACGVGRDSVRADRRDRLQGCELVRRR